MRSLSKQQLAARQVEVIDIASAASDYWSYIVGRRTVDFSKCKSARTGGGPLLKGWKVYISFFQQHLRASLPDPLSLKV